MKILLLIPCLFLGSCFTPLPPTPPEPTPPPVVIGSYTIREYDVNGNVKNTYTNVASFQETQFPRSVTFQYHGDVILLNGSYYISR